MPCWLKNNGSALLTLPYPFRGFLRPGKALFLNATAAQVLAALGLTGENTVVKAEDIPSGKPIPNPPYESFRAFKFYAELNAVSMGPSGDSTTDYQNLMTALAAAPSGGGVICEPGEYGTDRPIEITELYNGKSIKCPNGVATWVNDFDSDLDADDRSNAIMLLQGTLTGDTTAVSTKFAKAASSITFDDPVTEGGWVRTRGVNTPSDFLFDSCTAIISQLNHIDELSSGTTYTLVERAAMWCSAAITAAEILPLLDFEVEGLYFDASGSTIGSGMLVEDAVRIALSRIGGRNLSRAIISGYGARHVRSVNCYSRGTANGGIYTETCQDWVDRGYSRSSEGDRNHSLGTPRPELSMRAMCADSYSEGFDVRHGNGGCRLWGGVNSGFRNGSITDMDITAMLTRDPEMIPKYGATTSAGSVFDGGPGDTAAGENHAEFGIDCFFENITASECYQPTDYDHGSLACTLYYHDHIRNFRANNVTVSNHGNGPVAGSNAGFKAGGITLSDTHGSFGEHALHGTEYALRTANSEVSVFISKLRWIGSQEKSGVLPDFAILLDHANGGSSARSGLSIQELYVEETENPYIWCKYGTTFTANADVGGFTLGKAVVSGFPIGEDIQVMPLASSGGIYGVFVDYDADPAVLAATGAGPRNLGICVSAPSSGFALVAKKRGLMFRTASVSLGTAVTPDDGLGLEGRAKPTAIPASPASYGVATGAIDPYYAVVDVVRQ